MELNIRNARKMKGYTAKDMAKILEVTENTYRKYETKPEEMKVKHAMVIAKVLKLPLQIFFYEDD